MAKGAVPFLLSTPLWAQSNCVMSTPRAPWLRNRFLAQKGTKGSPFYPKGLLYFAHNPIPNDTWQWPEVSDFVARVFARCASQKTHGHARIE